MSITSPKTRAEPTSRPEPTDSGLVAGDRLRAFIERIERMEEEKSQIANDIAEIYAESKCDGFDVKTIREIIRKRKMDLATRQEAEMLLDTYMCALGMD